ncbi:MAG: tRNA (adenosine(37)-N6)-dimethylallyltransferase MiaA [Bdellovibrio sp.]|nr:MAG: tRNA (adenosine(37)-N6)-dimethylallyltransferase MiaA [Bdellovibrio sp.]
MKKKNLLFVVGPTAVGKSSWALKWAQEAQGSIINGDSLQVFKELNIGTAKPSQEDQSKVPHFLFGHVSLTETYTAGRYRREVLSVLRSQPEPFAVVGGSGFYLKALERGMYDIPPVPDALSQQLKDELKQKGTEALYQELLMRDPEYARQIHPHDSYRILRALGVVRSFKKMSQVQKEFSERRLEEEFNVLKVGFYLEKEELRKRVRQRARKMLEQGLIEEVQSLLPQFSQHAALRSVGYKEVCHFLKVQPHKSHEELLEAIVVSTMQLAKKQKTWFKKDTHVKWFHPQKEGDQALQLVSTFLKRREHA